MLATTPTSKPPKSETKNPHGVTPPFVPGGTGRRDVMRTGLDEASMPS